MLNQCRYHLIPPYSSNRNQEEERKGPYIHSPKTLFSRVDDVYSTLQNIRIIQKQLVYIIGLSNELTQSNICLCNYEYLGQYGKIVKLVLNKNKTYNTNGPNGPSYSCHATFSSVKESSLAILALDNVSIDNHVLKASYGTTKYCSNFLRNNICLNKDCLYLHAVADEKDIISKDQMNGNKSLFAYQHIMAIELSDILNEKRKIELEKQKDTKTVFPNSYSVYYKYIVKEYQSKLIQTPQVSKNKRKDCLTIMGLDKLYNRRTESRFFAPAQPSNDDIHIDVPLQISNFISVNFKRSILLQKEQDEVSQYYFSQIKPNETKGSWDSLINTLELYSAFDNKNNNPNPSSINKLYENDSVILVDKFNSV